MSFYNLPQTCEAKNIEGFIVIKDTQVVSCYLRDTD